MFLVFFFLSFLIPKSESQKEIVMELECSKSNFGSSVRL